MTENNALKIKVLVYVSHPLAILWEQKSISANSFLEILPRIKKILFEFGGWLWWLLFWAKRQDKISPRIPRNTQETPRNFNRQRSTLVQNNNTLIFSPVAWLTVGNLLQLYLQKNRLWRIRSSSALRLLIFPPGKSEWGGRGPKVPSLWVKSIILVSGRFVSLLYVLPLSVIYK